MRSFMLVLLCVGCAAARPPVKQADLPPIPDTLPDDPELLAACQPEAAPQPLEWQRDSAGQTVLKNDDPGYGHIAQIIGYDKERDKDGLSFGKVTAIVNLATLVIDNDKASPPAHLIARWHRAMAHHELGHWREAWLDFGAVVRAGPDSPFYKWVGGWLTDLAPRFSHQTYAACLSVYESALKPPTT